MNQPLSKIINKSAHSRIIGYVVVPYKLNPEGEEYVIDSNKNLPENYFGHLSFPVSNFWGNYFRKKIGILDPQQKNTMIDVCCGTGTLCLNVVPEMGFSQCIAIDNSQVAIDTLKKRIEAHQPIEARKEDITKTSFADNSIDAVYGNSFLHHIPDNHSFFHETFRILTPGGVVVLTGEPTVTADLLENIIMLNLLKALDFLRLRRMKIVDDEQPVTDIWLYEKESLQLMLEKAGFVDVEIRGFGFLVSILNWPSALVFGRLLGKSMQPEWYWRIFGWLDQALFSWLPANKYSHFVIAARKPL